MVSLSAYNWITNGTVFTGYNQQNTTIYELGDVAYGWRGAISSSVLITAADDILESDERHCKSS